MADVGPNSLSPRKESQNKEASARIVEAVIDEYDVIDSQEPEKARNLNAEAQTSSNTPQMKDSVPDIVEGPPASKKISHAKRLSSSDRANTNDNTQLINYPRVNCQERIIFCVDASAEMDKLTFRSRAGDKFSPKQLTKRGIGIFLQSKYRIDKKHEYGLILLHEAAMWVRDFTNNPRDIQVALEDIVDTQYCDLCDVGSVFDRIVERVDIPKVEGEPTLIPPPYIVRIIFIYGRSNCPLRWDDKESFNVLNASPYVFLDAVYLHEPPSDENQCQDVFDSICDLDHKGLSYIVGASKNPTKFFGHMAQLLAHPLQRPVQNDTAYRIGSSIPSPENG